MFSIPVRGLGLQVLEALLLPSSSSLLLVAVALAALVVIVVDVVTAVVAAAAVDFSLHPSAPDSAAKQPSPELSQSS